MSLASVLCVGECVSACVYSVHNDDGYDLLLVFGLHIIHSVG